MKKPIYKIKDLSFEKNDLKILNIKNFEIHRSACYLFNGNMASGKTFTQDQIRKYQNMDANAVQAELEKA